MTDTGSSATFGAEETRTKRGTARTKVIAALSELAEEMQITPREKFQGDYLANRLWNIAHMLEYDGEGHEDPETVLGAIRLALVAAADDEVFRVAADVLLQTAPPTPDDSDAPSLLIHVIRDMAMTVSLSED